jgi:hypothetical protein
MAFKGAGNPSTDSGIFARRLAGRALEAQHSGPGAFNQMRPLTDPQNQTSASLHSLNATARILMGMITDSTAIGNAYRVQFEKGKQPVVAFFGPRTTCSTFGAREINTLQPGTMVTCVWHEQMPYAQILTVIPPPGTESRRGQQSIIHGASRARVDEAHKRPFRMEANGTIPSFTAGRPFDALHGGEAGWITETGLKIIIDSFMTLMGVDESCQLSFHYHDAMARLAAYQLQIWSSVHEHESLNDQEEAINWTGYAMYPWENMGLAARADPTRIRSAQQWQINEPHYSKMEPIDDYMMPFHREREWHGYLGQGGKKSLVAPPIEFVDKGDKGSNGGTDTEAGARTQHTSYADGAGVTAARHPGLFDQFVTADGRLCMQSAKGISLIKRSAIMLPTRMRRPEDNKGDNPENYKFSSLLGSGAEHKITGDIETFGDNKAFNRAMGVMDLHAYMFNYAGLHPFFYHAEDFKIYQESEATWCGGVSEEVPNYNILASEAYIDAEDYRKTWQIDHRYGEQQFYTLSCGLDLLEDGGVVLYDGFGGSIRMTGGSIEISAPGDVWLKPGRNANIWSGRDTIIRAKHSFDITCSEADGRIKAENNLMFLGGNSGVGGILLESRGAGPVYNFDEPGEKTQMAGIVLRSTKAPIVNWSYQIYLRTGGPGIANAGIMLDAGRGEGQIFTYAQALQHYTDNGLFIHFGVNDEVVNGSTSAITQDSVTLAGVMCVDGGIIAGGTIACDGSLVCTGGVAAVECPFVGCLQGEALETLREALAECRTLIEVTLPQSIGQLTLDRFLTPTLYAPNRPGNDDVILKAEFSLRNRDDYRSNNFLLYEDRWQQLSRIAGNSGSRWSERPVLVQGQETYPFPGKEAFAADGNFVQQDLTIFDAKTGRSRDRGTAPDLAGVYAEPKFGQPKKTSLNEYRIIP